MRWKSRMEQARRSAREIETLTYRIANGGRDWANGDVRVHSPNVGSPTESAALMGLTVVPQLEAERERHERIVGDALRGITTVREKLGDTDADILEMFYIDGFISGAIAGELGMTVDAFWYRKRRALRWMDENLPMAG